MYIDNQFELWISPKKQMNQSIILGTLLGDAWIQKYKSRPNSYTFSFSQSNKDFAIWKANKIGLPYSFFTWNRYDKRTEKVYITHQVTVRMDKKCKKFWYELFYTPKKTVTEEILNKLDCLAIAVWYMDDGSLYYTGHNCHLYLGVDGFSQTERELIINYFKQKHNLNFKQCGKAIRLTSRKCVGLFMDIVEEYIPDCMKYKTLTIALERHKHRPRKRKVRIYNTKNVIQYSIEGLKLKRRSK